MFSSPFSLNKMFFPEFVFLEQNRKLPCNGWPSFPEGQVTNQSSGVGFLQSLLLLKVLHQWLHCLALSNPQWLCFQRTSWNRRGIKCLRKPLQIFLPDKRAILTLKIQAVKWDDWYSFFFFFFLGFGWFRCSPSNKGTITTDREQRWRHSGEQPANKHNVFTSDEPCSKVRLVLRACFQLALPLLCCQLVTLDGFPVREYSFFIFYFLLLLWHASPFSCTCTGVHVHTDRKSKYFKVSKPPERWRCLGWCRR